MRRYLAVALILMLCFSYFQISNYKIQHSFNTSHTGTIKNIKDTSVGYMVYVDDIVYSSFGEATGLHLGDEVTIFGEFQDVLDLQNTGFGKYLKGSNTNYIINSGTITVKKPWTDNFSLRFSFLAWLDEKLDSLYGDFSFFPKALIYGYSLDKELLESFRLSGTAHILALSGFHVSFIILFFNLLFYLWGIKHRYIAVALLLILYAYITGGRASIIRSVAFFCLYFISFLSNRRFDTLSATMLIACFMLAFNPYAVYNMGFVLSFLCVSSIAMFMPIFNRLGNHIFPRPKGIALYLYQLVLLTISSQILTLPYISYSFGRIALLSIPANILILPLVSILMSIIILSLCFLCFFPLARLLAHLGVIIINIILKINIFISNLNYANIPFRLNSLWSICLSVMLIFIFIAYEKWRIKENQYEL